MTGSASRPRRARKSNVCAGAGAALLMAKAARRAADRGACLMASGLVSATMANLTALAARAARRRAPACPAKLARAAEGITGAAVYVSDRCRSSE